MSTGSNVKKDIDTSILKIEFDQPSRRNKDETRSKYLHQDSLLYFFVIDAQEKLKHSGLRFQNSMAPHIEILSQEEKKRPDEKDLFLYRVSKLQAQSLNVMDKKNYKVIGKAFCMMLPQVEDPDGTTRQYCIKVCQLQHLALGVNRFTNIILDPNYSTFSDYEFTVFD
jgi:hypothetical protein